MNIQDNSRYHEVHARSLAGSRRLLGRGGARDRLDRAGEEDLRSLAGPLRPLVHRRRGQHLLQRARPPCRRRARRSTGADPRFAAGRQRHQIHLCQMLHEVQTLAAIMQDFGVAKGDRVILYMPMVPEAVVAMLACARIGAVHQRGVRRLRGQGTRDPDRGRQAKTDLLGELRARARPHRAVQAAARRGDQALQRQAAGLHHPATAAAGLRSHRRPRSRLGRAARQARSRRKNPPPACRCWRPIRSTSSTPRARPAYPRAWCATMAGIWSALKWSMFNLYGVKPGEVWWCGSDIGWVVGHSYIVYGAAVPWRDLDHV